jgi:hypothetical protein
MSDVMQSLSGDGKIGESLRSEGERGTNCVGQGFLPVLSEDDKRLEHDSFHPPQTEYTGDPQEAQN